MPGGPATFEGKQKSRQNAVQHGLSAKALADQILGRDAIDQAYQNLAGEWQPQNTTERILLREMARHQVALDRIEQMEGAALRRGAVAFLGMGMGEWSEDDERDAALAGAGTADAVDKVSRYRRPHEKGFYRSLGVLQSLRENRQKQPIETPSPISPRAFSAQNRFQTEADCEAYLVARFEAGKLACHCGQTAGQSIPSRKSWRCQECGRQVSLRAGTVMAGSRLSLVVWFHSIGWLIERENSSLSDLAEVTGLSRTGTLRRLNQEIRAALASSEGANKLAGLDDVFRTDRC